MDGFRVNQDMAGYIIVLGELKVTLPRDCKCPCHDPLVGHKVIHVLPCCGPGSAGWEHESALPNERDPYKALSLFGGEEDNKPANAVPPGESVPDES